MRVLVACESSGRVRDAFLAAGHDAISCDLKHTETPGPHYVGDIKRFLELARIGNTWPDLMVGFPPCTFLSRVSIRWINEPGRRAAMEEALGFFHYLWELPIPYICLENPHPMKATGLWPPSQTVHPYFFGDPYLKATCLWLKGLPPLAPTQPDRTVFVGGAAPRLKRDGTVYLDKDGKPRFERAESWTLANRGKHKFADAPPERSRTFPGLAAAMAAQWGNVQQPYGFFS